jgi:hypothetical protein
MRKAFPLTISEFVELHQGRGLSLGVIAKTYGVPVSWVSVWAKRNRLLVNKPTPKKEIDEADLIAACAGGASQRELALEFGISPALVHNKLQGLGLSTSNQDLQVLSYKRTARTSDPTVALPNEPWAGPELRAEYAVSNPMSLDELSRGSSIKAWWTCSDGHRWEATIKDRTRAQASGCPRCANLVSGDEASIGTFISQFGIDVRSSVRGLLVDKSLEIDLFMPELKIGIEVCGQYWHREGLSPDKLRHASKYAQAKVAGIRLLTVFDSELIKRPVAVEGYILAILGLKSERVYARSTKVRPVSRDEASAFIEQFHIQGDAHADLDYGLYDGLRLLATMSFRNKGEGLIELSRYCLRPGVSVPGGASKLLTAFTKARGNGYQSIISFSDNRWSAGRLYEALGFRKDGEVPPSYWYFRLGKHELLHKYGFRRDAISKKFGQLLPNDTEYSAMCRNGYDRIWDCGKVRWALPLSA